MLISTKKNELPDYFQVQKHITEDEVLYLGFELEIDDKMVDSVKDFTAFADRIVLRSGVKLRLHGRRLTLVARIIEANGCHIDTSGAGAAKDYTAGQLPKTGDIGGSGSGKGGRGDNGKEGSSGQRGGDVTIAAETLTGDLVVLTDGGAGGRGQDGGKGGPGGPGDDGADAIIPGLHIAGSRITPAEHGKTGGIGGPGGDAGPSGDGGDAGFITIAWEKQVGKIEMQSHGGRGGEAATAGHGGDGGIGGAGGRMATRGSGLLNGLIWTLGKRTQSGKTGKTGDQGSGGIEGMDGQSRYPVNEKISQSEAYLRDLPSSKEQQQLSLHIANLKYMQRDFSGALQVYEWLHKTSPVAGSDLGDMGKVDFSQICGVLNYRNRHSYVFLKNGTYCRYSTVSGHFDSGPVDISEFDGLSGLGSEIVAVVDYQVLNGKIYFFLTSGRYIRFDVKSGKTDSSIAKVETGWKGLGPYADKIVAAITHGDSTRFILNDGTFVVFSAINDKLTVGPMLIEDGFTNYAKTDRICAAVNWLSVDNSIVLFFDDGTCLQTGYTGRLGRRLKAEVTSCAKLFGVPTQSVVDQRVALHWRVDALVHQLRQGQDFFGGFCNHVPASDLDHYQDLLDSLFETGNTINDQLQIYVNESKSESERLAAFKNALDTKVKEFDHFGKVKQQLMDKLASTSKSIDDQTTAKADMQQQLLDADRAFQSAVENRMPHCSFEEILTCVTAIVTIVTTAETGLGEIEAVVELEGESATFTNYVKRITKIAKSADEIRKQWSTVSNFVTSKLPDSTKIPVPQQDFDEAMKPFLDLPEAQKYKSVMHAFVQLCQDRNAQVMRYNRINLRLRELDNEVTQTKAALDEIQSNLAAVRDSSLPLNRAYMMGLANNNRAQILRYLYDEIQAYNFCQLSQETMDVGDATLAELQVKHNDLKDSITDEINSQTQPNQRFNDWVVILKRSDHPGSFKAFDTTGRLHFALLRDTPQFAGFAVLFVNQCNVEYEGDIGHSMSSKRIVSHIRQNGRSTLWDENDKRFVFSHAPRDAEPVYWLDGSSGAGGGELGGSDGYGSISPIASWTLELRDSENPGVDRTKVNSVRLIFQGHYGR